MKVIICENCDGIGKEECSYCGGTGDIGIEVCPVCDGEKKEVCTSCWGTGDMEVYPEYA